MKWHTDLESRLIYALVIFVTIASISLFALSGVVGAQSITSTNLPETNPPPSATPRVFCVVKYLVRINPGVSLNVRPTPSRNTTPTQQINGTANPYSAVWTDGSWFELCSINRQYISGDPQYVTFVTVTPQPPTPTRLVTNTPTKTPTPSATPTPNFDWINVDTDHDGFMDYTLRCESPCTFIITDKEPSGILQVSVTEWPTRSPTP